jgi:DNA-binding NtrC family response regulator
MATRDEVLVFGCREDDLAVLAEAFGRKGPVLRAVTSATEFAQHAVSHRRLAIVLGVGIRSVSHLDLIPLIRAVRSSLPVIVIAEKREGEEHLLLPCTSDREVRGGGGVEGCLTPRQGMSAV